MQQPKRINRPNSAAQNDSTREKQLASSVRESDLKLVAILLRYQCQYLYSGARLTRKIGLKVNITYVPCGIYVPVLFCRRIWHCYV